MPVSSAHPIVLYDGVCGLCNGFVRFLLKRDLQDRFRFASLQSRFAAGILEKHRANSSALDTIWVVLNYELPDEQLCARSDAAITILRELGGIGRFFAMFVRVLPRFVRDCFYRLVAHNRYRIFGKYDSCPLPDPKDRVKFLDQ